jgi:hypothetical protein
MKPCMNGAVHVPRVARLFIASESVTLTIRTIHVEASIESTKSVDRTQSQLPAFGIRERNDTSGVRSTESVKATRVLFFWRSVHGISEPNESSGLRSTDPWMQREFWRSVHGIRVYQPRQNKISLAGSAGRPGPGFFRRQHKMILDKT